MLETEFCDGDLDIGETRPGIGGESWCWTAILCVDESRMKDSSVLAVILSLVVISLINPATLKNFRLLIPPAACDWLPSKNFSGHALRLYVLYLI